MKKTNKIIMGVTALIVAFSSCALTACSDENKDGSIKGDYQEATAEQINDALKDVNEETLFGDTTAKDFKLGLDVSSNITASFTMGEDTSITAALSAGYQMLATGSKADRSFKGAGNITMKEESKVPQNSIFGSDSSSTTNSSSMVIKLDLYQDNLSLYASAAYGETEEALESPSFSMKILINFETIMGALSGIGTMLPSGDEIISSLPGDITLPDNVTMPDLSAMDLVESLNLLNEMGATISMDTKNGIKLKISFNEDSILSLASQMSDTDVETIKEYANFTTFKLDYYLVIDKDNKFKSASVVTDIDVTYGETASGANASTSTPSINVKISGNSSIKVDSSVNPAAPENFNSASYYDYTSTIIDLLQDYIGSGSIASGEIGGKTYVGSDVTISYADYVDNETKAYMNSLLDTMKASIDSAEITFNADGTVYISGVNTGAVWSQNGDTITLDYGVYSQTLKINGNKLEATESTDGVTITMIYVLK